MKAGDASGWEGEAGSWFGGGVRGLFIVDGMDGIILAWSSL